MYLNVFLYFTVMSGKKRIPMIHSSSESESQSDLAVMEPLNPNSGDSSSNQDDRDGEPQAKRKRTTIRKFLNSVKEEFRSVYESHPALYDHNHPDYNDHTAITMAKKKMGKQFRMSGVLLLITYHTIKYIYWNWTSIFLVNLCQNRKLLVVQFAITDLQDPYQHLVR